METKLKKKPIVTCPRCGELGHQSLRNGQLVVDHYYKEKKQIVHHSHKQK